MNPRTVRTFLIAVGILVAVAVVFHFFAPGAMRALGEAIHGR
jgi:uncharacterized membrane protein YgaE (UPF0421/DUF939 family)